MEGFDYVVNPIEIPRVCFGSSLERNTLPLSGPSLTPFMRAHLGEVREYPGPLDYSTAKPLGKNFPSNLGFSGFSSKIPRPKWPETFNPPPWTYDVCVRKPFKQAAKPFGVGAAIRAQEKFLTPGPPTYPYHVPLPKMKISTAFGSKRKLWPVVAIFCSPFYHTKCYKCLCSPVGDYWHNVSANLDMCRTCMRKERQILKNCSTDVFYRMRMRREFEKFTRARYCGFFHDHKGTTAATQLISNNILRFKTKKENYLYLYEKD